MKTILIGVSIVVLGLAGVNIYARITESSDFAVKFHIYKQEAKSPFDILLRRIPANYDTMIIVDIIEPFSKELNLYKVNNNIYGGTPDLHYVVYDKDNSKINDLKSGFLFRKIKDLDNVSLDTIDSYSVDIMTFRQIFEPHFQSNSDMADKYARMLANSQDSTDFKKINDLKDTELILVSHTKTGPPMINPEETLKDFDFLNNLEHNEFVYWFYDKGLIKFQLNFKDTHLANIRTKRIGNLGVEITHL